MCGKAVRYEAFVRAGTHLLEIRRCEEALGAYGFRWSRRPLDVSLLRLVIDAADRVKAQAESMKHDLLLSASDKSTVENFKIYLELQRCLEESEIQSPNVSSSLASIPIQESLFSAQVESALQGTSKVQSVLRGKPSYSSILPTIKMGMIEEELTGVEVEEREEKKLAVNES